MEIFVKEGGLKNYQKMYCKPGRGSPRGCLTGALGGLSYSPWCVSALDLAIQIPGLWESPRPSIELWFSRKGQIHPGLYI